MNENRYAPPEARVEDPAEGPAGAFVPRQVRNVRRFLAAMLVAGGVAGVGLFLWLLSKYTSNPAGFAIVCILIAILGYTVFVGASLWKDTPFGRKWATVIYATQIPAFAVPGLTLGWFTGISIAPAIAFANGSTSWTFNANIGANAQMYFGTSGGGSSLSVNLFALAAFLWLRRLKRWYPS